MSEDLNVDQTLTDELVNRFAVALKAKLNAASEKYGHGDDWAKDDWRDHLVKALLEHVSKGDPRDVAAYCAFAWHHGWSVQPDTQPDPELVIDLDMQDLMRFDKDVIARWLIDAGAAIGRMQSAVPLIREVLDTDNNMNTHGLRKLLDILEDTTVCRGPQSISKKESDLLNRYNSWIVENYGFHWSHLSKFLEAEARATP